MGNNMSFLRIWSHMLKKSIMENFIFLTVFIIQIFRSILNILLKSLTQNYHPASLRKKMGVWVMGF